MFHPLTIFNRNRRVPTVSDRGDADPFFRLQSEMNRLFDDALSGFGFPDASTFNAPAFSGDRAPRVDVRETENAFEVEAELPGVAEDDIDVQLSDNVLTIRGEKRAEKTDEEKGEYRYVERSFGSFARSIPLSFDVDPDTVEAVFKNGVLKLTLPKPPGAQNRTRKISIKRG